MNTLIKCCGREVVVPDQSNESMGRAADLLGFNRGWSRGPHLRFYDKAEGGGENQYGAIVENTDKPLTK